MYKLWIPFIETLEKVINITCKKRAIYRPKNTSHVREDVTEVTPRLEVKSEQRSNERVRVARS